MFVSVSQPSVGKIKFFFFILYALNFSLFSFKSLVEKRWIDSSILLFSSKSEEIGRIELIILKLKRIPRRKKYKKFHYNGRKILINRERLLVTGSSNSLSRFWLDLKNRLLSSNNKRVIIEELCEEWVNKINRQYCKIFFGTYHFHNNNNNNNNSYQ